MSAAHIVITGVSRGLGRALVDALAVRFAPTDRAGMADPADADRISGCARSADAIRDLNDRFGAPHRFEALDISDAAAVARWARALLAEAGPPTLLINNAGVINTPAPLHEVPLDEFRRVLDVNVTGTFNTLQALLPAMLDAGRGTIVNLSSGWGRSTAPDVAPYCASKFAIEGLTRALADELPAPLAAVALNPGVIDTDMLRAAFGDGAAGCQDPRDWAERAVPYLLSLGRAQNGVACTVP